MKRIFDLISAKKVAVSSALVGLGYLFGVNPDILRAVTGLLEVVF